MTHRARSRIRTTCRAYRRPSTTTRIVAKSSRAAATGIYDIRGAGAKRKLPHFDDLLFLGASISRYPLEGYREKCGTDVVLGTRFAKKPIELKIPVTIAGMSFGALSGAGQGSARPRRIGVRHVHHDRRRRHDGGGARAFQTLVYQYLPSRYGMNPNDLRSADAIEIVVGQGAKPGGGGMLLGQKISDARRRDARPARRASTSARPAGIPTGPAPTISRSRSRNCARSPIGRSRSTSRSARSRPYYDTALAVKAGADVVVLDGMQGGTAATQDVFIEHVGHADARRDPPGGCRRCRNSACTARCS